MRTHTIHTFRVDELSKEAQAKAIANSFHVNVDDEYWSESVLEDAKHIGGLMGIDIEHIYFSGFSCQGDGAQFVGTYLYQSGSVEKVLAEAPQDEELAAIATALRELQKPWFYTLSANVRSTGRYCHEYCTSIEVSADDDIVGFDRALEDAEVQLTELLRTFMRWIYAQLRDTHDNLTEDDQIRETLIDQEHEFLANGSQYTAVNSR